MTKPTLIIGKPHSGKTTFIAQLYARIDSNNSLLKLYKAVDNLSPIIEALRCLAKGEEVEATPTDKSTIISLPLQVGEHEIDLYCPDYGGEQINSIIENREVDSKWSELIYQSQNWLLFIRPSNISTAYDLSNKTIKPDVLEKGAGEIEEYSISDQSAFIELLQIFLHIKGMDAHFKNSTTKLTIVLTCWDEINSKETPKDELRKCLPLLLNFVESNWIQSKINIIGLSALGFSLKEKVNKDKYLEEGSENFGFMIKPDGKETPDIAELILESI
jgi:hypothetical protein